MKVVVGSASQLKIDAVASAFASLRIKGVVVDGVAVESSVDDQPFDLAQMEIGARTRARNAKVLSPGADYYIGIENGIVMESIEDWFDVPCVVVHDAEGRESVAYGAHFPIPQWAVDRTIHRDSELGVIVQELAGGGEKDPMTYFSGGTVSREAILTQAVCCALAPFLNPERYKEH